MDKSVKSIQPASAGVSVALASSSQTEAVRLCQTDHEAETAILIPSFRFGDRFEHSETVVRAKGEATCEVSDVFLRWSSKKKRKNLNKGQEQKGFTQDRFHPCLHVCAQLLLYTVLSLTPHRGKQPSNIVLHTHGLPRPCVVN